jgi:hypothetical protein
MPGCNIDREIIGSTACYRIAGKFESACAWELAARIESEPLGELLLDFSQCGEFVDYGIAVLASALLSAPFKRVHLEGVRQHQLRLFKYFGVDADELSHRADLTVPPLDEVRLASEVA